MNLIYTNALGQFIDFFDFEGLEVIGVDGLHPTALELASIKPAYQDGVNVTSATRSSRQVLVNVALTGGPENEYIRETLYRILGGRDAGVLRVIGGGLDVSTVAYTEAPVPVVWSLEPTIQLAFTCPSAFWHSTDETIINLAETTGLLHFPLIINNVVFGEESTISSEAVNYSGQVDAGLLITLRCRGEVINPVIANQTANKSFLLTYSFQEGDVVQINTEIGEKGAFLTRGGVQTNLFNAISLASNWLRIYPGINNFAASAANSTGANLLVTIKYKARFWGIG